MRAAATARPSTARPSTSARRARRARTRAVRDERIDFLSTTLIVDDLVFADGTTRMAVLGGGGPQTLFGAAVTSDGELTLGLVAGVGEGDCPETCARWLADIGAEAFLLTLGTSTPRAWQITERDGRRTQVWRLDASDALYAMLRPKYAIWPEKCKRANAVHFGLNPSRPDVELVQALREGGCGLISIEPFTHAEAPLSRKDLENLVSMGDVFSPNEREARSFFAKGDGMSPKDLIKAMRKAGATICCLRRGSRGAMVYDSRTNEGYECEALSANVADETGCGNAFCGAFAAALAQGATIRDGLIRGTVAASIMLEHVGVPNGTLVEYRAEAARRANLINPVAFSLDEEVAAFVDFDEYIP